jgi:hypothetical protein
MSLLRHPGSLHVNGSKGIGPHNERLLRCAPGVRLDLFQVNTLADNHGVAGLSAIELFMIGVWICLEEILENPAAVI